MLTIFKLIRKYYHFPIPAFLTKVIDNPIRRRFIHKPDLIANRMHLEPGMKVLEIGPGKGSYTKAVAKQILPNGTVYAIDIQESVIINLQKRLEKEGISNIKPITIRKVLIMAPKIRKMALDKRASAYLAKSNPLL